MGLLGMEERASLIGGRIELKSGSGEGTEVHAWFPLVYSVPEQAHSADLAVQ
jgi:signal transduction histidine kinase